MTAALAMRSQVQSKSASSHGTGRGERPTVILKFG